MPGTPVMNCYRNTARAQVESWLQNISDCLEFGAGRFPIDDHIRFGRISNLTNQSDGVHYPIFFAAVLAVLEVVAYQMYHIRALSDLSNTTTCHER